MKTRKAMIAAVTREKKKLEVEIVEVRNTQRMLERRLHRLQTDLAARGGDPWGYLRSCGDEDDDL